MIGSQSSISHRQAELLAAEDVVTLTIEEATLDKEPKSFAYLATRFAAALADGKDVLLLSRSRAVPARFDRAAIRAALRHLIAPHGGRIGGLFATGGETAREVLASLGSHDITACRRNRTRYSLVYCRRTATVSGHYESGSIRQRRDDVELPARPSWM